MCLLRSHGGILHDRHLLLGSTPFPHGLSSIDGMDGGANPLLVAHLNPLLEILALFLCFLVDIALFDDITTHSLEALHCLHTRGGISHGLRLWMVVAIHMWRLSGCIDDLAFGLSCLFYASQPLILISTTPTLIYV